MTIFTTPAMPGSNNDDLIVKALMGRTGTIFKRSDVASADSKVTGLAAEGTYYYAVRSVVFSLGTDTETTGPECGVSPRPPRCTKTILYVCDSSRQCGIATGQNPLPLVEGVEQMQFAYGVDTNNDLVADIYSSAATVETAGTWNQVVSIRVGLVVRGDELDSFTDSATYNLPGGYSYSPATAAQKLQRRSIVRDFQIRNRLRS